MTTLREYIADVAARGVALGHFNISNMEGLWGIAQAAKNIGVPVIIGLSEGEREFFGMRQAVLAVRSVSEDFGIPMFVNADHTYSFEKVKEAIDAGVDAAIFDGTELTAEERTETTKKCVEYARASERDVLIEGELGYIGRSSKLLDEVPEGIELTSPEEAAAFVKDTGVDMIAPAVGNLHGILKKTMSNPRLEIDRIQHIRDATSIPLVLHGGSGTDDEDFVAAIKAGMAIVHINTEIRIAWKDALAKNFVENPDEVAPYKIMRGTKEAIQKVAEKRLMLFSGM